MTELQLKSVRQRIERFAASLDAFEREELMAILRDLPGLSEFDSLFARRREHEFRALVENNPDTIVRYDRQLRRLYLNPAAAELIGRPAEELAGTFLGEFLPGGSSERRAAVLSAFDTGAEQTLETRVIRPDGEHVHDLRVVPEFGEDGSVVSVLTIGRDITGRRHAEVEATSQYEQLRALVQAVPIGILIVDAHTRTVLLANREHQRLINRQRRPGASVTPEGLERFFKARRPDGTPLRPDEWPLFRALDRGEFIHAEEVVIEHPDGSSFPAVATAAPVLDANGDVVSVISVLQDISPIRELDRLRSDFLAMVGHELRTPLAVIRLAIGSLMPGVEGLSQDEVREALQTVDQQAERIAEMLTNLRDVAQIEAGVFSVHPEPADLREMLWQAQDDLARIGVQNIRMNVPQTLRPVLMDRRRVLQVVENLLNNAAAYGGREKPIAVDVEQTAAEVTVHVRNRGHGIPRDRQQQLFRKFSRLGRSRHESGTGLGLVICKGIVEAHRGRIWVDSTEDAPVTTFSFTLPLAEEAIRGLPERPAPPRRHRVDGRARVLVVDDDPRILRNLKRVLDRVGYETITAAHPEVVEHMMAQQQPDLILLDLALPEISGFDLYQRLRPSGVPVIFISGTGDEEDLLRAREMGTEVLVKPVDTHTLVSRIDAALGVQRTAPLRHAANS